MLRTCPANHLFTSAWESLKALASDERYLGCEIGMLAVLHTRGQQLQLHPHQLGEPEVERAIDVLWPDGADKDGGEAPAGAVCSECGLPSLRLIEEVPRWPVVSGQVPRAPPL